MPKRQHRATCIIYTDLQQIVVSLETFKFAGGTSIDVVETTNNRISLSVVAKMASKRVIKSRDGGYLIAVIGDEDTATGFLLAGVGDNQPSLGPNYFVVDPSM